MTAIMPADADRTPLWESSSARQSGRHAQPLGRLEEGIGRRLAGGIVAVRHYAVEPVGQAMHEQVGLDCRMRGRRGDRPRQTEVVQQVQQLDRAGLERQAGRSKLPEVPPPRRDQGLKRIVLAIVPEQEGMVDLARTADKLKEDVVAHRAADFGRRGQDRLRIEPSLSNSRPSMSKMTAAGRRGSFIGRAPRSAPSASSTKPAPTAPW